MRYFALLLLLPLFSLAQENKPKAKSTWYIKAAVGYGRSEERRVGKEC